MKMWMMKKKKQRSDTITEWKRVNTSLPVKKKRILNYTVYFMT